MLRSITGWATSSNGNCSLPTAQPSRLRCNPIALFAWYDASSSIEVWATLANGTSKFNYIIHMYVCPMTAPASFVSGGKPESRAPGLPEVIGHSESMGDYVRLPKFWQLSCSWWRRLIYSSAAHIIIPFSYFVLQAPTRTHQSSIQLILYWRSISCLPAMGASNLTPFVLSELNADESE